MEMIVAGLRHDMKVVLSAGVDRSALQEWGVQHEFLP
jgi:hypothetical protein